MWHYFPLQSHTSEHNRGSVGLGVLARLKTKLRTMTYSTSWTMNVTFWQWWFFFSKTIKSIFKTYSASLHLTFSPVCKQIQQMFLVLWLRVVSHISRWIKEINKFNHGGAFSPPGVWSQLLNCTLEMTLIIMNKVQIHHVMGSWLSFL